MSYIQKTEKTFEVKVRDHTTTARSDQNGIARIYLTSTALSELNLKPGQLCHIWRSEEETHMEAIAWNTTEKSLGKGTATMSREYRNFLGIKLGDVNICAAGTVRSAETIVLRDLSTSDEVQELQGEEKMHWIWFLRGHLSRADIVFPGMKFTNLSPWAWGHKRNFIIDFIDGRSTGLSKIDSNSSVRISSEADAVETTVSLAAPLEVVNIAGIDQALKKLNRFLSNFDKQFKFTWPQRSCAVLLHGGHGTGKTFLLNKIISTGWSRNVLRLESDAKLLDIRTTFRDAKLSQPSVIVIDDLESLVSKDDARSSDLAKALGEELDILAQSQSGSSIPRVLVIATALNTSNIPMLLKKRGRFRTEIMLPIPDVAARKAILKSLEPPLHPDRMEEALNKLGDRTHAYTAEDLVALLDAACEIAEERAEVNVTEPRSDGYHLDQEDIEQALLLVRPTAMHDITLQPPNVRWDEIGGQDSVKNALRRAVETPLLNPARMKRIGASPKKGLLLYGPPGCSKTLSAQAMATEVGFNFFAVKGAELLNMYVGESERAVRDVFARARAASPSIIFFDEIESIGSKRTGRNNGVNVLTTLLNEMDGIETLKGVTVLAATNQPQALDLALLRPGRFDKLLYVAPPDLEGRKEILQVRKRTMDLADDVDIARLAELTDGYSGAELVGICQTACDFVMEKCEETGEELQVQMEDFLDALKLVKKQITPKLIEGYEKWAAGARGDTD
ncbi:AAA family ATPase-like protein [Diplocarpon rosae]|nr:AAA family ATPase-like protein [Diplocarpon rosae]